MRLLPAVHGYRDGPLHFSNAHYYSADCRSDTAQGHLSSLITSALSSLPKCFFFLTFKQQIRKNKCSCQTGAKGNIVSGTTRHPELLTFSITVRGNTYSVCSFSHRLIDRLNAVKEATLLLISVRV